eukprot:m.540401 g.540401  ORF g.540401 m.540401 type:complete len:166 (-) comp22100_c0_seq1:1716-2213(-)
MRTVKQSMLICTTTGTDGFTVDCWNLAAATGRFRLNENFPRVHDVVRIQCTLDASLQVDVYRPVLHFHVLDLANADTVFATDTTSHCQSTCNHFLFYDVDFAAFARLVGNAAVEVPVGDVGTDDAWKALREEILLSLADHVGDLCQWHARVADVHTIPFLLSVTH